MSGLVAGSAAAPGASSDAGAVSAEVTIWRRRGASSGPGACDAAADGAGSTAPEAAVGAGTACGWSAGGSGTSPSIASSAGRSPALLLDTPGGGSDATGGGSWSPFGAASAGVWARPAAGVSGLATAARPFKAAVSWPRKLGLDPSTATAATGNPLHPPGDVCGPGTVGGSAAISGMAWLSAPYRPLMTLRRMPRRVDITCVMAL